MAKKTTTENHCSFCGRPESQTGLLLAGLDGFICRECAERAKRWLYSQESFTKFLKTREEKLSATDKDYKRKKAANADRSWELRRLAEAQP